MSDTTCKAGGKQLNRPEPPPLPNARPATWELVIEDMRARDHSGRAKYGTPLQPFNGRNNLIDLYQELLDACVYVRNEIEERGESRPALASPARNLNEEILRGIQQLMNDRDQLRASLTACQTDNTRLVLANRELVEADVDLRNQTIAALTALDEAYRLIATLDHGYLQDFGSLTGPHCHFPLDPRPSFPAPAATEGSRP